MAAGAHPGARWYGGRAAGARGALKGQVRSAATRFDSQPVVLVMRVAAGAGQHRCTVADAVDVVGMRASVSVPLRSAPLGGMGGNVFPPNRGALVRGFRVRLLRHSATASHGLSGKGRSVVPQTGASGRA
ncbi:hypothetical protein GCM10009753_16400 [Streptantibioticus ferralitis]